MSIKDELNQYWKAREIRKFASELRISGRSKMNTSELIEAISKRLDEA